ncbi:phytoene dehydrogenase [Dunaliella salina]|uniref:Phytoene dehydrogenase n=1 Tax=Dunaliella salina TaxID=3046 RepID=A0ABQ7GTL5_DUNSA|nr:phytoene dehydrogenase [Dunaliella salina]|eukprot:KAF5837922.1 phytoene dehydrogenase [Dunaliella salina]
MIVGRLLPDVSPCSHWSRRQTIVAEASHASTKPKQGAGQKQRAIVIGGGIGGITLAAKLAKMGDGLQVTLLEQNEQVGGRCQSMYTETRKGIFRFDTGPSLLLFPGIYQETFASLGVQLEERVPIHRVSPAVYRVWFEPQGAPNPSAVQQADEHMASPVPAFAHPRNGGYLDLLYDIVEMRAQLDAVEEGAGRAYLAWLSKARTALEVGLREFIQRDFDSIFDFLDLRRLLPLLTQVDIAELLGQHHQRLASRFNDPRLQALFSFQDLYVGLSPYTAPGVFSLLAATEITDGVFYPMGGFQQVKQALADVAEELGVEIRTSERIVRVNTVSSQQGLKSSHRATGVLLENGEELSADVVISNRGEESWKRARRADELLPRPNFYVHCPTRTDPTAAPEGCESIMVLLPVANLQEVHAADGGKQAEGLDGDSEADLVAAGREAIARTFREEGVCEDLWGHVLHQTVIGPREWKRRYSIEHGAVFGLSHGLSQLAIFRPGAKTEVDGFYLVGASARPGNGVPLVMISADLTAKRVLHDLGSSQN